MNILISGATRGIGRAIAEALAAKNHHLFLIARSTSDLTSLKATLKTQENKIDFFPCDLSQPEELEIVLQKINSSVEIDVLINNLGIFETNQSDQIDLLALKKLMDINLYSAINLTNSLIDSMKEREQGIILNVGSVMSHLAAPFAANYSITKHAFKGWNDSLREELRQHGVKVCAIYPGAVNTSSWDGMEVNRDAMIQPEDIAKLIMTLLEMKYNTLVEEIRISPLKF